MVGQGMSDNPMNAIVIPSPLPVEISLIQVVGITRSESYIEAASGSFDLDLVHKIALDLGLPLNLVCFFFFLFWDDFFFHTIDTLIYLVFHTDKCNYVLGTNKRVY